MLKVFVTASLILAIVAGTINSTAEGTTNNTAAEQVQEVLGSADQGFLSKADAPISSALNYLISCQNEDGGFGPKPESESDLKATSMAVISMAAIGEDLKAYKNNGKSPLDYLLENQEELSNLTNAEAQVGRYVVAMVSAGLDPRNISGKDYIEILKGYCSPNGEIGKENYVWDDAWVIIGLAACNQSGSDEVKGSLNHLKGLQTEKGGWAWNGGANGEDTDTTSIILCALIGGGEESSSDAVKRGLKYLHAEQNQDGGFSSLGSNAATDGWTILALNAAGENPRSWKVKSTDPIDHLLSLQKEDGSIWWKKDSEGFSFEWTANGMMALTGGRMPPEG
jgi:squalene cyclase